MMRLVLRIANSSSNNCQSEYELGRDHLNKDTILQELGNLTMGKQISQIWAIAMYLVILLAVANLIYTMRLQKIYFWCRVFYFYSANHVHEDFIQTKLLFHEELSV